jgi:hypothetical protein
MGQSICTIKEHTMFGNISFFTELPRTVSARSKSYTILQKIDRKVFLKILKDHPSDYEKFCEIRDKIMFLKDQSVLEIPCFTCCELGHNLNFCP